MYTKITNDEIEGDQQTKLALIFFDANTRTFHAGIRMHPVFHVLEVGGRRHQQFRLDSACETFIPVFKTGLRKPQTAVWSRSYCDFISLSARLVPQALSTL